MNCNANGLVLKAVNLSESDRILTVLAEGLGKISVSAKGARGLKNKRNAVSQPFCYANYQLYKGREIYLMNGGECISSFFRLQESLEHMALAGYFVQLLDFLTDEFQPYDEALRLTLNSFYVLTEKKVDLYLVKAVYELRLLSLCGYMPALAACHRCGAQEGQFYFSAQQGVISCSKCGSGADGVPLPPGVLQAMRYAVAAPLSKIFSFHLSKGSAERFCAVAEQFALTHLDRGFKGLDLFRSL